MARNINAEVLTKGIEKYFCNVCSEPEIGKCKACEVAEILSMIDDTPTAAETANAKAAAIMAHYGAEHQKDILIEECAELIQAVEKSRRGVLTEDKPAYTYDMISEMADVLIMLWQFESIMTTNGREWLENEIQRKLRRQMERIEAEKEDT